MQQATKKSFIGIEDAYAFFQQHSTQHREMVAAVNAVLEEQVSESSVVSLCDFGCGDGGFTVDILKSLLIRHRVDLHLLDPNPEYLNAACSKANAILPRPCCTFGDFDTRESVFDVILSNHVLYYVGDLENTLGDAAKALKPNGLIVATLAASTNSITACMKDLYAIQGKVPYWGEADLDAAFAKQDLSFEKKSVPSIFQCLDNLEARLKLIRFLTGVEAGPSWKEAALNVFSPYARQGELRVPMLDNIYIHKKLNGSLR